jgi:hypothetical protein
MDHLDLINRIPPALFERSGLATQNFRHIEPDKLLVEEMIACLRSSDETDVTTGLRFAECLCPRANFCRIAGQSLSSIAALVRKLLSDERPAVRLLAIGVFVTLREFYPDYREFMVSLFRSADPQTRSEALSQAETFLAGAHLRHLLTFRDDPTVCQSKGERHYALRDLALETAERVAHRNFDCGRQSGLRDGVKISWRRWTFFTNWLDRVQWRASEK